MIVKYKTHFIHHSILILALVATQIILEVESFTILPSITLKRSGKSFMSQKQGNCSDKSIQDMDMTAHPSTLPGDPSLSLITNLDLGDKKVEIMKACSKAISARTGKPEAYIGVTINDNAALVFGGSDAPAALGCLYSIGAISMESNGGITSDVTELLEPFGLDGGRIYINFFDMPRANVGWNKRTFAG